MKNISHIVPDVVVSSRFEFPPGSGESWDWVERSSRPFNVGSQELNADSCSNHGYKRVNSSDGFSVSAVIEQPQDGK